MCKIIPPHLRLINNTFLMCNLAMVVFWTSCVQKKVPVITPAEKKLAIVDSLYASGNGDSGELLLKKTRPTISNTDPAISVYYAILASSHYNDAILMNLYADSALTFFKVEKRKEQYPNEYYKALMVKGDACLKAKNYIAALNYYFKGKNILTDGNCDNGNIDTKMAGIYYDQKNYKLAGRYWAESAKRLDFCYDNLSIQKIFGLKQGALNNAGFSYELAGLLDSANFYYLQNLKLINEADSGSLVSKNNVEGAKIVLYDNLGGLNLKKGNFALAEVYLNKSIAISAKNVDGIKIPPLLKIADLYLKKKDYPKAKIAFEESQKLLNQFYKQNINSAIEWNRLYSQYLFSQNDAGDAYRYQQKYIKLRDSINDSSSELYRLDVERELSRISQNQAFIELQQTEKIRLLSLLGIGVTVVFSIIIIILISRNLKREKNNNTTVTSHNKQLQYTLEELERVNQNYIRMMRVMAHDLRNPLSGITGMATMLLGDDVFSEDSKHMLQLIETTGMHTMEMINELLKSGLANDNEDLKKQTVDLKALLFDSVELLQFKAKEKQQQILFDSDEQPIIVDVNHENMWRVFNNLIVNAIKFSHPGGTIRASIKAFNNRVIIAIADDGIGIPEKDKEHIFEMFTPAKKTGTNGEQPFGLGLSISKKIIEKHQGKIWFKSKEGVGTTFYIQIPITI